MRINTPKFYTDPESHKSGRKQLSSLMLDVYTKVPTTENSSLTAWAKNELHFSFLARITDNNQKMLTQAMIFAK